MKTITAENKIICQNEESIFNYFAWPTVCRLPGGALAMVCSGFRTCHVDPFGKSVICYSFDEGKTWTRPATVIDTDQDDRDSGIVVYGNGKVFVNTFNNGTKQGDIYCEGYSAIPYGKLAKAYMDSIDTEEADRRFYGSLYTESDDGGFTFGKIKRCPVQSPHGPCVTKEGNLLFVGVDLSNSKQMKCYQKTPDGEFEFVSDINTETDDKNVQVCEPHAVALPDGKIIVHFRVEGGEKYGFTILQAESTDGGKSFTPLHSIGLDHGSPAHIIRHSSGVLISAYGYRREPFGERVMFSADDGETWETDYVLRDDGGMYDLGYPATVELNDGSLLTVYYQRENGSEHDVIMQSIWKLPEKFLK